MRKHLSRRSALKTGAAVALAAGARWTPDLEIGSTRAATTSTSHSSPLTLWYRQPAQKWVEALPIGNGRLGAMIFGGAGQEHLQLNEDTLYAGGPYDPNSPEALAALPEARRLIFAGEYDKARILISQKILARPIRQMPYQTLGDLLIDFPGFTLISDYRRELNLDNAIARVSFVRAGGVRLMREMFASAIDQVIVVRLTADKPGKIAFTARMESPQKTTVAILDGNTLLLRGKNGDYEEIEGKLRFAARVHAISDGGSVRQSVDSLFVDGANSVTLLIAMATSYKRYDDVTGDPEALTKAAIEKAAGRSFDQMRADHIAEHQRLFRRVSIDLGRTAAADRPTDERVRDSARSDDPALAALYYQFGRYLLISSSRPGTQPANLQGIWNDSLDPPWGSKYTININTEMNYWPAETTNLSECADPLIEMVKEIAITGAHTAKVTWGTTGDGAWVCHHNTDLWRATAPIDGANYGMWPAGGAWLCLHLWERYLFHPDKEYLATIYPILKGAAQFFLETLVEEPKHKWLVTCPSLSPEHEHRDGVAICAGPTMDQQIIRDLFGNCIRAANILAIDEPFKTHLAATMQRLAPMQIGKTGLLQEWLEDWDLAAPDLHHRHISQAYGLFPSHQIDVRTTPQLSEAMKKSLNLRGDLATGWAIAWRINLWARLGDGERAHHILKMLLDPTRTYPNLFDAHPPFQIDGNFGGTSGMTEMLLQSHDDEINLLPALPKAWPQGEVKGLRARGGYEVDIAWRDGALWRATIRAQQAGRCRLRYGERQAAIDAVAGGEYAVDAKFKRTD